MAPLPEDSSFPHLVYPSLRDTGIKDADQWLEGKSLDDGAEGLWRVGDKLYDLTDFIRNHPGGKDWISLTKGTDITEAFEIHHLSKYPERILSMFYIRDAKTPRNSPFTFKADGFYRTLKSRVVEELKTIPKDLGSKSKRILELLAFCTFLFAVLTINAKLWTLKVIFCILSGLFMAWTAVCAHNFFHRRDNWRMYMFNLTFMASDEWRVTHALSHHLYPNTLMDFEMSSLEPLLQYLPRRDKSLFWRYSPAISSFFVYFVFYKAQGVKRLIRLLTRKDTSGSRGWRLEYFVPFSVPLAMKIFSNTEWMELVYTWMAIIYTASFIFAFIGLNAAHHHPDIFHDGDAPPKDTDWGIFQLVSVMDRKDINQSHFLVLTNFGDHSLHHLFPTLDHEILPFLYPVVKKTCAEFKTKVKISTQFDLVIGQVKQLVRNTPKGR